MSDRFHYFFWIGLWLILTVCSLLSRPLLPLDESRYVGVAWEMWTHGDFLVPHLNGEPYSHKAPLLFWLVHVGWFALGVNDWWPRLMPALSALGSLFLAAHIARHLWPHRPDVAQLVPIVLLGTSIWIIYTPAMMFDMILVFWVLAALAGLLAAAQSRRTRGWIVFSLAMALGILTKGPVMLLHVLVPALLLPFLLPEFRRRGWYIRLTVATGAAVLLVLLWAVPAALEGGAEYARAIFWGQTSGRVVDSFAHQAPWWWYLAYLPVVLFPWLYWPRLWSALRQLWRQDHDRAAAFCVVWFVIVLAVFSLISGKRLHYLLPAFPALALLAARALAALQTRTKSGGGVWPVVFMFVSLGLGLMVAPEFLPRHETPDWQGLLMTRLGVIMLGAAVVLTVLGKRQSVPKTRALQLSTVTVITLSVVEATLMSSALPYYDLRPVSQYLHEQQEKGVSLATVGKYHDQFQFYGRLTRPLDAVMEKDAQDWGQSNPEGLIVSYYDAEVPAASVEPVLRAHYRGGWLAVWRGADLAGYPELARAD
ncbi:MAG: glycosyltransferase family 39 protein [Gammaproteobacteria bacterium]|nr:glycosyltransferase family 39 protein [Gammaproteobacteria bacterium]